KHERLKTEIDVAFANLPNDQREGAVNKVRMAESLILSNISNEQIKQMSNYESLVRSKAQEAGIPEDLFLVVFLIVISNFLISIVFAYPLLFEGKQIPENFVSIIVIVNFFIYYILLLMFFNYYTNILTGVIKKYKFMSIIFLLAVGLMGMVVLSYITLGMVNTLQWLIPTIVTIVLMFAFHILEKYRGKNAEEEKPKDKYEDLREVYRKSDVPEDVIEQIVDAEKLKKYEK
ncbi:hypothetical protein HYU50_00330, partial [Candidatus Woesearchaeota archaeon]|nr:hypothetical protein [Candidatus Woesearchaeota archaeon]